MNFIEQLKAKEACDDAVEWASNYTSLADAWDACHRPDWMLWLHDNGLITLSDRDLRLFGCDCVRYTPLGDGRVVWDLLTDERSRNAVEVAERFANGDATSKDLARGSASARASVRASVRVSAWAMARASARESAWESAWESASAFQADLLRKRVANPFYTQTHNTPNTP